ncbi:MULTISPECIES: flagellar hook-associated protein FlgL [unclassified Helicobacter]|uniref:flagellar hook-associated protein FlgL n=1 Tax=unclassified Helicobacter TaxID=2593540 RepID=UPI000CF0A323|nr:MULTISPECIES: flagellar hook-associated protein FlgL [unclassified Helicobacter]
MRVTFGTKYNQMNYHQNTLQNKLNSANNKIASGLKIQQGYEDSSVYNQDLKLDYETATLGQSIDVAKNAEIKTLNTDKTLSELSQAMVQFKTKLLQAANNVQSETSRKAIASDLRGIKHHMLNLANTSVGGEYIFAGSKVDKIPFDSNGNYYGNNETLSALISSNNLVPYNITGEQLFLSRDADTSKHITTNIKLLNQSKLHPNVMEAPNNAIPSQEVYLTANDTIRDLVGDNDNDTTNDGKEYFYIRGVGADGVAFKSRFAFDKGYGDRNSATTIRDLLNKIGEEFGNTSQNKVVDVSLNDWGQIEIKDLRAGSSSIQFHMISSDTEVDDITQLYTTGARITNYVQSPFMTNYVLDKIRSTKNYYNHAQLDFNATFITNKNTLADRNTMLRDIVSNDTDFIVLKKSGDQSENVLKVSTKDTNIKDFVKQIQDFYGSEVNAEFTNGKLVLIDKEAQEEERETNLFFDLETLDSNGNIIKGFASDFRTQYDQTFFTNQGSKLVGNVVQSIADGIDVANEDTKLSEVTGTDMDKKSFKLTLRDHNGIDLDATITLDSKGSYLSLPNKDPKQEDYIIPIFDPHDEPPTVTATKANDVTYRQLMDVITIALNYSNQNSKELEKVHKTITQEAKEAYEDLLDKSNARLNINLDQQGKVVVQDKMASNTKMKVMFSNDDSDDFSIKGIKNAKKSLTLNANNAITIDQPQINFFAQIDEIIDAVDRNIYRPGAFDTYNSDMRNLGIQNGILTFDHLSDHIEKMIALNGSHGRTFGNIIRRNEILKTQVESMKAENIGIDVAETYNKFSNLNNNYNAVLNSTSKINQMSLVNYL